MANGDPLKAGFLVDATSSTGLRKTSPGSHVYIIWSDFTDSIFCWSKTGTGVTGVGKLGMHAKGIDLFSNGVQGSAVNGIGVLGMIEPGFEVALPKGTGVWGQGFNGVGVRGEAVDGLGMMGRSVGGVGIAAKSYVKAGIQTESTSGPGLAAKSDSNDAVFGQSTSGVGVFGASENSGGVYGLSQGTNGVTGTSAKGVGVQGVSGPSIGVHGVSTDAPGVRGDSQNSIGVVGASSAAAGVTGASNSGYGVHAASVNSLGAYGYSVNNIGIRGETSLGRAGVMGVADQWLGVRGKADQGIGVGGSSLNGRGVAGYSDNGTGVEATSLTGIGLVARRRGGTAGFFDGNVDVRGNFTVAGAKSAAVPHPDGSLRRMYSLESPESWFEDFGEVELVDGVATVNLDPDFAALVDLSNYHVFLTSYAPVSLYVHNRTRQGFEIRLVATGSRRIRSTEPIRCGYRVLAHRKDIVGPRLEPVISIEPPAPFEFPEVDPAPDRQEIVLPLVERLAPPALPDFSPLPDVPLPEAPPPLDLRSPDEYMK